MPGRRRWVALAVGTSAQTVVWAGVFAVPVLAPALEEEFSLGLPALGLAIAASSAGMTLTFLGWGLLVDRVGERLVFSLGLAAAALALVGAASDTGFLLFTASMVLFGMAGASATTASTRAVVSWFPPGQRGLAFAIRQTSLPAGALLSALALPPIAEASGLRSAFLVLAGACAASAVACAVFLRAPPVRAEEPDADAGPTPLRDARIWRLSFAGSLLIAPQVVISSFTVVFFVRERGFSLEEAALVLAGIRLVGVVAQIAAGSWTDRRGDALVPLRRLSLVFAATVVAAAALTNARTPAVVAAWIAAGAVSLCWNGLSFAAVAELAGHARSGTALGLHQTVLGVAAFLTPLAFAALVDASSWWLALGVCAVGPLAAYLVFVPLQRGLAVPRLGVADVL